MALSTLICGLHPPPLPMAHPLPWSGTHHGPCNQPSALSALLLVQPGCAALLSGSPSHVEQPCSCWSLTLEFVIWYSQLGCHSGFHARSLEHCELNQILVCCRCSWAGIATLLWTNQTSGKRSRYQHVFPCNYQVSMKNCKSWLA